MTRLTPRLQRFIETMPATPVLALDLEVVAERYRSLESALPGVDLYYAIKANPAREVLETLSDLGCRFDVASVGEVELCRAAGIDGTDLSFGNTIKRSDAISAAVSVGVERFSFDSDGELDKLTRLAPGSLVSVRILCDGAGASWPLSRKFGCSPPDAVALLRRAGDAGHRLGVSFHVGSQQLRPEAWDAALAEVAEMAEALDGFGFGLDEVNLGGGFPASLGDGAPPIEDYGAHIMKAVGDRIGGLAADLVAEPGRYLVADAGALVSEVVLVARKSPADAVRWVYVDAGVFSGLIEVIGEAVRYPLSTSRDGGPTEPSILAGPTCDSIDVLYEQQPVDLPVDLVEGDQVVFSAAGAYTTTYSSVAFNGFDPLRQVVLASDDLR